MWLQLLAPKQVDIRGVPTRFLPGDWVNVGKHDARLWLARGEAHIPKVKAANLLDITSTGVLVKDGQKTAALKHLEMYTGLNIEEAEGIEIVWNRTAIFDTSASVQPAFFSIGFGLLDKWEIAAPLYDYKTLAANIGTDEEREMTKAVIHDLRVPVYDTRLLFVKRTETTIRLVEMWNQEPGERRLAFMRALYKVKPFILALPCNWSGHSVNG